ncbi:hypothetical protein V8E54_007312 [Elaphomyces granulatus]
MTAATAVATVTSGFDEDSTATNLPIEISDDFIDIEDDDFLQQLGFDPAQAAARSRSFRRTGTLAQALDGTGDRFVDIGDDLLEDGLLDLEDDLPQELDFGTAQAATPDHLDVENDLQQELNSDTAQAAIPAARPPIAAPQRLSAEAARLDQGTRRPYRLRPPLRGRCKLCKLVDVDVTGGYE